MASGDMNHEEFVQYLFGNMSPEELAQYAQYGESFFKAAADVANNGNHQYDYLGAIGERIAQDTQRLLNYKQQKQG